MEGRQGHLSLQPNKILKINEMISETKSNDKKGQLLQLRDDLKMTNLKLNLLVKPAKSQAKEE